LRKLEKGKPSEKMGRKVTDLSLRKRIRWQDCRATSEDPSSNPTKIQNNKFNKSVNINQSLKKANHFESVGRKATILTPGITGDGSRAAGQKQYLFEGCD